MKRASLHWNKAPYRRLLSLLLVAVMLFGFTGLIGNAWAADDEDVPAEEIAAEIQEEDPSEEDPDLPGEEDPSGDDALPEGETASEDDGESEGDEGDAPPARMGSTPAQHFEGWANDIAVFVDAPENALPAGTVMEVVPVYDRATIAMIEDTVAGQGKTVKAVDISFWLGVTEIEPYRSIYVTLKSDVIATADEPAEVVHVSDEGEVSVMRQLDNTEEDEVSFASREFSVYAVIGGSGDEARMQLNFHLYDGTVVPMTIKNGDNTLEKLQEIVYDPGSGVAAGSGLSFLGWTTDNPYDADSTRQSIDKIREYLLSDVIGSITETDPITTVDYYAAVFKIFTVTYYDEFGVSLGSEAVLLQPSETSSSYMVNMNYPVDDSHNFEGWKVMTSEEPGYVYTGGNIQGHTDNDHVYPNETTITITGDVDFVVEAPAGHWLVFDENGKGATFNAPQFYKEGVPTEQTGNAVASEMKRYGYSFGGWYKEVTGEADEMGYRQVVESSRYDFNEVLTENRTIYAKWTKNATAPYTIIFWTQNESSIQKVKNGGSLTPQDYEVAHSYVNDNGVVGQNIPYTSVDNGAEDYARGDFGNGQLSTNVNSAAYTAVMGHYRGFGLTEASKNQQVEITAEGDAVLNLYYDRIQYNFKFYLYRNGTQNNRYDYANNSGTGSSLDGVVTWHSNQTEHPGIVAGYTIDGHPVSIQSESVSGRTYYYFVMPAYYGEDISGIWPTYDKITGANNRVPVSYVMMVGTKLKQNATSSGTGTVKGLISVMNENILGATNDPNGNYVVVRFPNNYNDWRYHIWFETVEGEDYSGKTTHTYNGKTYYLETILQVRSSNTDDDAQNEPKYPGFDYITRLGQNGNGTVWQGGHWTTTENGTTLYHLNYVYDRQLFKINYFDGQYVDGNNNNLQNRASHLLHESEEIQFGAAIADGYKNYVPTLPEGESGYVFEGWYVDEGCTVEYTWTTMPLGGINVYAKWRQIQYRVFLHPNANIDDDPNQPDPSLDWGSENQQLNFRISYGDKVSAPTGTRIGYEFLGWYYDPGLSKPFNAELTPLNDSLSQWLVAYDKDAPENATDVMDQWGNGATWNSDKQDAAGNPRNRWWITKKLDLYGKWMQVLEGADGINIVYDAGDGTGAPTDDTKYKDNTVASAQGASTPNDTANKRFDHWEVLTWDNTAQDYVPLATPVVVYPGGDYTVLMKYAKVVVTEWRKEKKDGSPTSTEGTPAIYSGADTITGPAGFPYIKTATYTVKLKAVYIDIAEATPTHIYWYSNDGTGTINKMDGLHINEAADIPAALTRTGYEFLGWSRQTEVSTKDSNGNVTVQTIAGVSPTGLNIDLGEDDLWLTWNGTNYTVKVTENGVSSNVPVDQVAADENLDYHGLVAVWRAKTYTVRVTKEVEGNMGDVNKAFSITVSSDKAFTYNSSSVTSVDLSLKDGQHADLLEVPFGANLTVSETGADGYTMSLTYLGNAASNPIDINDVAATPQNIVVTNTKNVTPDTGIEDTAGPMMTMTVFCIVALCAAGTAVAVREKRRRTAR